MFKKETFLLIKKTYKRFVAIVLMVFIGVGFMMGLMNSSTIMKESVSRYAIEYNLQDVQLYSPYGFCREDVDTIKKLENVENVFASRFVDSYCLINDSTSPTVVRVREKLSSVNKYNIIEGSMTRNDNEILVSNNSSLKIGDKVKVYLEEDDISEKLSCNEFTVTGIVETPDLLSKISGTSTLDNMDLDFVCYANNDIFKSEYYTSLFVTFNDTNNVRQYTDEYETIVENDIEELKALINVQQEYLKEDIIQDVKQEIFDGEKELEEKKADGQEQLDAAKDKLDNANIQIVAGEMDIETYKQLISTTYDRVGGGKEVLDTREEENNKEKKIVEEKFNMSFDEAVEEVSKDYTRYTANEATIQSSDTENIQTLKDQRDELQAEYDDPNSTLDADEKLVLQAEIQTLNSQIASLETLNGSNSALRAVNEQLNQKYIDLGYEGIENAYTKVMTITSEDTAIKYSRETLNESYSYINEVEEELVQKEKELEDGKKEYQEGYQKYTDSLKEFNKEIEKAETEIKKAYQDLEELPEAKWTVLDRDKHYSSYMFKNNANQMGAIGVAIPIMFCLVAALVCMTTMTRLIDEQRASIGTFIALGYSKKQVLCKYLVYAFLASIIGSIPGVIFGNFLFPTVIYTCWRLMYLFPDMIMLFPIKIVLLCVFVFSIIMMSVTYFVVNKSLKEKPASLLRPKSPKSAKQTFIEKITFIWKRLSFTSKITARNLIRYKTRFFMTVIGVAGCTGLLVIGFGIRDSISDVVDKQYGQILNYNYSINLENDDHVDELVDKLKDDITNEEVVPFMSYYSKAYMEDNEETIVVDVIDQRESTNILKLQDKNTREDLKIPTSGCIITEKFAKNNNLKVGDYITFESSGGIKKEIEIKGICKWYFEHYIFISENYYESLFDETISYTTIAITSNTIDNIKDVTKDYEEVESISDFTSLIEQFNIMIEALNMIIIVIIVTAGALAFVVLFNLTNVNISERTREIATLKVLGFRNNEVNNYIFKEIILLTVIGALLGLPLGKIEENFIMTVINMENIMFGTDIHFMSYVYSFLITFIFTFIVLMLTKKPLKKIQMVESLKSVE